MEYVEALEDTESLRNKQFTCPIAILFVDPELSVSVNDNPPLLQGQPLYLVF